MGDEECEGGNCSFGAGGGGVDEEMVAESYEAACKC